MARTEAELAQRSQEADVIIADLTAKIEQIKAMGKLPPNIQETILKQENAQLRLDFKASPKRSYRVGVHWSILKN